MYISSKYYNISASKNLFLNLIMNLDTLSNGTEIQQAVAQVNSQVVGGKWVLLGYVDAVKKSGLMTIEVKREGTSWSDLLDLFEDDKIQYGYAKIGSHIKNDTNLVLIHWVGKEVGENETSLCVPHLNEIRNIIPSYDLLISSMDTLDIQAKTHGYISRSQSICGEKDKKFTKSDVHIDVISAEDRQDEMKRRTSLQSQNRRKLNLTIPREVPRDPLPSVRLPKVKVAIIGSTGVGKTFIYMSYNGGGCPLVNLQVIPTTMNQDCMTKDVRLDQHNFTLEIWDTAGQEKFVGFAPVWTRNAKVVICVYDITDEISYKEIPKHMYTAKDYADPRAIFILVGNKADLVQRREVQEVDGEKFATQQGMMFMECSGLTGLNILNLFESITRQVVCNYQDMFVEDSLSDVIRLTDTANRIKKTGGCMQCT